MQCGEGMCCAVSLWIRSLRMCAPIGQKGDECHPMSHKVGHVLYIISSLYYLTAYLTNQYLSLHLICIGTAERVLISLQNMYWLLSLSFKTFCWQYEFLSLFPGSLHWHKTTSHMSMCAKFGMHHHIRGQIKMSFTVQLLRLLPLRTTSGNADSHFLGLT